MKAETLRDLASRLIADEELSAAEEEAILNQLQLPEKREKILADEAIDTLLRALVHIGSTSEDFVAATLSRAEAASAEQLIFPSVTGQRSSSPRKWHLGLWWIPVACVASLLIGLALWRVRDRGPEAKKKESAPIVKITPNPPDKESVKPAPPAPRKEVIEPPPSVPEKQFARLAKSENAVWQSPLAEGDWVPVEKLQLTKGTAELHFGKGSIVRVTGPAEFALRNDNEVDLRRGTVAVRVPPEAVGFTVRTPVSRVVDRGAEFDISVSDLGLTEVVVHRGRLALTPQREGERPAKTLGLAAAELDRAQVSVPDLKAPILPISTQVTGSKGQFVGLLSVEGNTGVFQAPAAFQKFETAVLKQLSESPDQFKKSWTLNVQVTGRGSMAIAWVEINGERHQIEVYGDDSDSKR